MIAFLLAVAMLFDLAAVRSEPALDKRALRAFDHAFQMLMDARKEMEAGGDKVPAQMEELGDAAELALETLDELGKPRGRHGGTYKKAELRARDLLRRLATFRQDSPFEERTAVAEAEKRVLQVQDRLLGAIMGRK